MSWSERFNLRKAVTFLWPFPTFGWQELSFTDKFKLFALYIQIGAAVTMTAFAAFSMWMLVGMRAIWPVFWLGLSAMAMIFVVVTGLASLLIKRALEVEAGPLKIKANDAEAAKQIISDKVPNVVQPQAPPMPTDDEGFPPPPPRG